MPGKHRRLQPAEAGAQRQQRREYATGRTRTGVDDPHQRLHQHEYQDCHPDNLPGRQLADHVIAHTQRLWLDAATNADRDRTDQRPPHPVHRQLVEHVLGAIHQRGQRRRQQAGKEAADHGHAEHRQGQIERPVDRKQCTGAQQRRAQRISHEARNRHRYRAAWTQLEQQQLHRGQVEHLAEQRTDRAAGHDDRAFRPERTAGADRDRRRQRLQNRHLQHHLAFAEQDRLQRLGDAVAGCARFRSAPSSPPASRRPAAPAGSPSSRHAAPAPRKRTRLAGGTRGW